MREAVDAVANVAACIIIFGMVFFAIRFFLGFIG